MKKYYVKLFLSFLIFVGIFSDSFVMAGLPLAGKIIVIDVGHGGKDPGSMYKNIYEKDINLAISLELEKSLTKLGASVILVRRGDYDLSRPNATWRKKSDFDNRIRIINTSKADYYLSIHLNYLTDKRYYGPQVFYNQRKNSNQEIAEQVQTFFNEKLGTNREVKKIPSRTYMYDKLNIPGVLIECGFLSNSYERELLITKMYQKKLANIIAEAISSLS